MIDQKDFHELSWFVWLIEFLYFIVWTQRYEFESHYLAWLFATKAKINGSALNPLVFTLKGYTPLANEPVELVDNSKMERNINDNNWCIVMGS